MKLTVVGATGRTGRPLVSQGLDRGHEVVAFVRSPEALEIDHERLTVVAGDAYAGEGLRVAVAGADAVASVLGQSEDGPDDLLTVAGDNVVEAMRAAGVDRYVTLVGAGVRMPGDRVPLSGRVMGTLLKRVTGDVLADAEGHVERVRATDLDWTVLRVPRPTDGDGAGDYRAGDLKLGFESVARVDVARCLLDCIEDDRYVRETPQVSGP